MFHQAQYGLSKRAKQRKHEARSRPTFSLKAKSMKCLVIADALREIGHI